MKNVIRKYPRSFRCTDEELEKIDFYADSLNLNRSNYIVQRCLSNQDYCEETSQLIIFLESVEYNLIRLEKGEIRKKDYIELVKREMKMIWLSLK